jgi:hypothetical protein
VIELGGGQPIVSTSELGGRAHARRPQAKKNAVSTSYAKALVDLADEKSKLEPVHADMDAVASLIKVQLSGRRSAALRPCRGAAARRDRG